MQSLFSMGTYATSTFFVAVMVYNLGLMVGLGSKEHSPRAFSLSIGMLATWLLCGGFSYSFAGLPPVGTSYFGMTNMEWAAFFIRGCYLFGTLLGLSVFYFSLTYLNINKPSFLIRELFFLSSILVIFLYYIKDIFTIFGFGALVSEHTIIADAFINANGYLGWHFGSLYILFDVIFFSLFSFTLATLWQRYKQQIDPALQKQALAMFLVIAVGFYPGAIFNTIFPAVGIFGLFWVGFMSSFGWVGIMAYSILKQNQMNVMMVTNELIVVAMILLMFIGFFAV
jgi:hypothetical protein